jgi:outer membrane protein TolC
MRLLFIVTAVLLLPVTTRAQTSVPSGPLTLEQVLELAEARSEAISIARAGIRRAEGEEVRARSGLFPQLSATLAYDRALASEFEGVFDDVDFGGGQEPAEPGAGDDGGFDDLPFGRENTWRLTLNLQQNIFDFGRIRAQRRLATSGHETATITLDTSRAQLLFEVTQAYYNAALSDRLVAIAEATLAQAGATLQQAEAAVRAGTQPEFEVLRARVSRDTQNPNLIRARVNREVALLRLRQLLDLPPDAPIQLADSLADDVLGPPPAFAARVSAIEGRLLAAPPAQATLDAAVPSAERAPVRESAATVSLRQAALDLARAQRLPAISLTTSYGRIAYPTDFFAPTFDRTNWTVGVNLQVPILTGGRQRGDEIVAEAELDQSRVRLRQVEELASLDTRSAVAELMAARAAWEATAGTVQQATRAFELAGIRYEAGVSTQLELSDSRVLLQQAEANRAQAARDLQIARARVALLPNLPIGTGVTGAGAGQQQFVAPAPATPQQTVPATGGGQIRNASTAGGAQQFGGQ